jgi:peroxiredoxin
MGHMGEVAPDFVLKDQNDAEFRLSDQRGKKVILSFHPLAWTEFCAGQMISLEKNADTFSALNTVAVGISIDPRQTKRAWAKSLGISRTRLLSDFWPHGAVATKFGLFREKNGISERAHLVLDEEHRLIFFRIYPVHSVPDITEIIDLLKETKPGERSG